MLLAALGSIPVHHRDLHLGSGLAWPEGKPGDDSSLQAVDSGERNTHTPTIVLSYRDHHQTFTFSAASDQIVIFYVLYIHNTQMERSSETHVIEALIPNFPVYPEITGLSCRCVRSLLVCVCNYIVFCGSVSSQASPSVVVFSCYWSYFMTYLSDIPSQPFI